MVKNLLKIKGLLWLSMILSLPIQAQTAKSSTDWLLSAVDLMQSGYREQHKGLKFKQLQHSMGNNLKIFEFTEKNPSEFVGKRVFFLQNGQCVTDAEVNLPEYRHYVMSRQKHMPQRYSCFRVTSQDLKRFEALWAAGEASQDIKALSPANNQQCEAFQKALPPEYHRVDVELVAGAGHELPRDFQIADDQYSGGITFHTKLNVHYPDKEAVVLVLKSYYPNVWDIAQAGANNIKALYLTGYHQSTVIGLPDEIPILRHSYDVPKCTFSYGGVPEGMKAAAENVKITRQSAYHHEQGLLLGSESAHWERHGKLETVQKTGKLDGEAGVQQLVTQSALTPMSSHKIDTFFGREPKDEDRGVYGYQVNQAIELPDNMYGGYATVLFLPDNVEIPQGDFGHNTFYLPSGLCWGAACP